MTDGNDFLRLHDFALEEAAYFQRSGDLAALDVAAWTFRLLAETAPTDFAGRPAYLNNLANALGARYRITRDPALLDEAIATVRAAIRATPPGHRDEASRHNNLGNMLDLRSDAMGADADRRAALQAYQKGLSLTPDHDPARAGRLSNIANALHKRGRLDSALAAYHDGLALPGVAGDERLALRHGLGVVLLDRYQRDHAVEDLHAAIDTLRLAAEEVAPEHLHFGTVVGTLMAASVERFRIDGDTVPLREAMAAGRRSVEGLAAGRYDLSQRLNNYFVLLYRLYQRTGHVLLLDEAVQIQRAAVAALSGRPHYAATVRSNLGAVLYDRFERTRDVTALRESIEALRPLTTDDTATPAAYAGWASNLSGALLALYREDRDPAALDEAVEYARQAAARADAAHPAWPVVHNSLCRALRLRAAQPGDLLEASSAGRIAVNSADPADPNAAIFAVNLGWSLLDAFHGGFRDGPLAELELVCRAAATSVTASPVWRIRAARLAAEGRAAADDWPAAVDHYARAVGLLDLVTSRELHRPDQEYGLTLTGGVATDAAAAAVHAGSPTDAVVLLEQGRALLWGQSLDAHTGVDVLRATAPGYADRMERVQTLLNGR